MGGSPVARLEPQHRRLLWLLGVASFFEGYDVATVGVALPQLREAFGLSQSAASLWVAVLYLGAGPALFLTRRADRFGRRPALLVSITGYTVATALTAMAPSMPWFAAAQVVARLFLAAEVALAWTVVAEELPARSRGFGFGLLALATALGAGWASLLQAVVLAPLGASWRWLYAAAVPVLVVAAALRRSLPESGRFTAAAQHAALAPRWTVITQRPYRSIALLLCGTVLLLQLTSQATVFVIDFMQSDRGLSASQANLTLIAAGALVLPLLTIAGRVSDRVGRKPVAVAALGVETVGLFVFFFVAHGQLGLFLSLALVYAGSFGAWPTVGSYGPELFPTQLRALGSSAVGVAKLVGQFSSFVLAGALITLTGTQSNAVAVLAAGPVLGAVLVAWRFPETGGRELEEVIGDTEVVADGVPVAVPPL